MIEIRDYNLIVQGLKEFQDVFKFKNVLKGKILQSSLDFAFWKALETRAGGKLDKKTAEKNKQMGRG